MSIYKHAFGLQREPFQATPDPALLFLADQHREALAGLAYAIAERKGFAILTGPAGTGKTTLLRRLLQGASARNIVSSVILNPTLTPAEFLEAALLDFGMAEIPASKAQRIWALQRFLLGVRLQNKIAALVVDEAHKLTHQVIEEVRLLSNIEFGDEKLLQIVLVGQSELLDLIDQPGLGQFKQRIAVRLKLGPLKREEVSRYLEHRWAKAGAQERLPFSEEAASGIAQFSQGIPRLINNIADNALLQAFAQGSGAVGIDHVEDAARDLGVAPRSAVASSPRAPAPAMPLRTLGTYEAGPGWWDKLTGRMGWTPARAL